MPTTTELTEKYISEHLSIKDCLKKDVINYSKLSRKIAKDLGIEKETSMEAILIAARRYSDKIKSENLQEDKIISLLKESELEIRNKIIVMIVDKSVYIENLKSIEKKIREKADNFYAIEGTKVFTIITSEKYLVELKELFKKNIKKINKNLAMIVIKSPKEVETTPGYVSYIYSILGGKGINIVETLSCWTDTLLVISEEDIPLVMASFRF